jgi:hypothetical protein
LWKVLVETKDIPRRIGGMTAKERGQLIKEIRAQQKRVNEQRAKRASMLEDEGLPEEVKIHGTTYRRVLDTAKATLDDAKHALDGVGAALQGDVDATLERQGVNFDTFATTATGPFGSFTRTITEVTVPADTGEPDGEQQTRGSDEGAHGPSQTAEGGLGDPRADGDSTTSSSARGSDDGSAHEAGEPKAAYDW